MTTERRGARRVRDAFWLVAGATVLARSVSQAATSGWHTDAVTIAFTAGYALGITWVVLGCWRRTSWHRPGTRDQD